MSCAWFQDRLYDEDSRLAQRGQGHVPQDLAVHMQTCVSCRWSYEDALEDEATLSRRLQQKPSPALPARIFDRIQDRGAPRPTAWTRWFPIVSDSLTAGAVAVALSSAIQGPQSLVWRIAVFTVGGGITLFGPRLKGVTQHLERSLSLLLAPY